MPKITTVVSISDGNEPNPWLEYKNKLYIGQNYGANPNNIGFVKVYDISTGTMTTLFQKGMWAHWHAVFYQPYNKIYAAGEGNDDAGNLRATITVVNVEKNTVEYYVHPNTADANEFHGVAIDVKDKVLYAGERVRGGSTAGGTNWPNGGGLWVIPIDSVSNTSTWKRVWEHPNGYEWRDIVVYGEYVYATWYSFNLTPTFHGIARATKTDLTTWSVVEGYSIHFRSSLSVFGKTIAYVIYNGTNYMLKYSNDGSTWSSITLPSGGARNRGTLLLYGKYAVVLLTDTNTRVGDIIIANLSAGTATAIAQNVSNMADILKSMCAGVGRVYFLHGGAGASLPVTIDAIEFDTKYILTLTSSVSSVTPGGSVTLTAKLVDSALNPVPNATIEFYVVRGKSMGESDFYGDYIGSATTDANGNASITYTVPTTATGQLTFRAVFKG
jgi:hypothetical protein